MKAMEKKLEVSKLTTYSIKLIGHDTLRGIVLTLREAFQKAYPDVDMIDQVDRKDKIFWGNVPMNLRYLYDQLKEFLV